jgi:hypothetical protein
LCPIVPMGHRVDTQRNTDWRAWGHARLRPPTRSRASRPPPSGPSAVCPRRRTAAWLPALRERADEPSLDGTLQRSIDLYGNTRPATSARCAVPCPVAATWSTSFCSVPLRVPTGFHRQIRVANLDRGRVREPGREGCAGTVLVVQVRRRKDRRWSGSSSSSNGNGIDWRSSGERQRDPGKPAPPPGTRPTSPLSRCTCAQPVPPPADRVLVAVVGAASAGGRLEARVLLQLLLPGMQQRWPAPRHRPVSPVQPHPVEVGDGLAADFTVDGLDLLLAGDRLSRRT